MRTFALLLIGGLLITACSGEADVTVAPPMTRDVTGVTDPGDVTTTTPATEPAPDGPSTSAPDPLEYSIEWQPIGDRVDESHITVPVDYADPQGDTIDLYVVRHRADDDTRIGPLLVNRGGPGAGGSTMAVNATSWFQPQITDNFDVIGWDPRGTGRSEGAVDCIDDDEYDHFFSSLDVTPDDQAEHDALVDLAQDFAQRCIARVADLDYIGTNNSARDMDAIRQALHADQVSYFGFSYGSELGGVWTTMFPTTVRAAVFDGASDPNADALQETRDQWIGFEASLDTFLEQCSQNSSCAFYNDGDPQDAFDELMSGIDANPLPTEEGRADLNLGAAITGVVQAMYSDRYWPALERALEDAQNGDGAGLMQLQDAYYGREPDGSYSNLIEAFQAIECADDPERPTVAESDADAKKLTDVAPRLFPYTTGSYSCTFFPPALDPRIAITGAGAGPIVVIGTTGDPATPLASSKAMADTLEDGRLVIVDAQQHTGYRDDECVDDIVHEYLLQLTAPDDGVECS